MKSPRYSDLAPKFIRFHSRRRLLLLLVLIGLEIGIGAFVMWSSSNQRSHHSPESTMSTEQNRHVAQLITLLQTGTTTERIDAARALGQIRSPQAIEGLSQGLRDADDSVRAWSAWALGEIGARAAVPCLLEAMVQVEKLLEEDDLGREGKCLTDFYLALEKLTGQRFGLDVQAWVTWGKRNGYWKH